MNRATGHVLPAAGRGEYGGVPVRRTTPKRHRFAGVEESAPFDKESTMPDRTTAADLGPTPVRPPLDPELAPVEAELRENLPALSDATLPEARRLTAQGLPGEGPEELRAGGRVRLSEFRVPGPEGAPDLTLLVLSPAGHREPVGGIYHIHAGGTVVGDRRNGLRTVLPFVAEGAAVVVSVEYRLAPEHPDPAPVEDCYAGLVWTAKNAERLGIRPERLLVLGASAGGGLAAGTALLARDRGFPGLSHQVLMCPMLDDRFGTHSSRMLDGTGTWDRNAALYAWNALLGDRRGGPDVSPYAAPARAADLAGLPRTYLDTGSAEGFRDEILDYARRLSEAGVSVDLHMWGGGFHGFDWTVPDAAVSRAATATREAFVRRALDI
ncbi:alpha/beta hydrolase [Streptomyces sp. NPDC127079]|uniref:alpha/beta hydrolase n=1 Tax=Streptomyces sp. NPDC127079 TaxID=3347132 RepID=UPI003650BA8A